jgi:hypothetical protein
MRCLSITINFPHSWAVGSGGLEMTGEKDADDGIAP